MGESVEPIVRLLGFQKQLNGFANIGQSLLDRLSLRLAALQFRTPRVTPVLILFDYDTNLALHQDLLYRRGIHRAILG